MFLFDRQTEYYFLHMNVPFYSIQTLFTKLLFACGHYLV